MPRYGFNFQWMYSWDERKTPLPPDERALDFIADQGFDFVRIPTSYWFWTKDFDYFHPDESVWQFIDSYLAACVARGLHLCLNLHRAPGYCVNRNDFERHNLWLDEIAQDAFVWTWEQFALRYRDVPNASLSFDLVNEPPGVGDYGMTRESHAAIVRRTVAAIRAIHPEREVVIDGLAGGSLAMPELTDIDVIHSGRGYQPMPITHQSAAWWPAHESAPPPVYPGVFWDGVVWDKETLRDHYQPWREIEAAGRPVHIGEFGCYNKTPNDVALVWFADILSLFKEFGWGYSLWDFEGAFGIIDHGRAGAKYELIDGLRVDRALLDLLLENRITEKADQALMQL